MLDQLPPAVRHAILMLLVALLTWASTGVPGVETLPLPAQGAISTIVALALAFLTPLTRQYGVGTPPDAVDVGPAVVELDDYQGRHESPGGDGVGI